jgi:hypothetical protein
MVDNDEYIQKLTLETSDSQKAIQALREELEELRTKLVEYSETVLRGETPTQEQIDQLKEVSERFKEARSELQELIDAEERYKKTLDESIESIRAQAEAQNAMRIATEDVGEAVETTLGKPGGEEGDGGSGLKGLAKSAFAGEKAITQLATGHGMMRLPGALETVATAMGGTAGLGTAIGAVIVGVEVVLPALDKLWKSFDSGWKDVEKANKAIQDFDYAQKGAGDALLKRSVHEMDQEIQRLEDKEREGFLWSGAKLNEADAAALKELRAKSKEGHAQLDVDRELAKIGPNKKTREIGQAVQEAITEAGGVEAVLGPNPTAQAKAIMAAAIKGDEHAAGTLASWSTAFADQWQGVDPRQQGNWAYVQRMSDEAVAKDKKRDAQWKEEVKETIAGETEAGRELAAETTEKKRAARTAERARLANNRAVEALERDNAKARAAKRGPDAAHAEAEAGVRMGIAGTPMQMSSDAQIRSMAQDALNRLPFTGGDGATAIMQAINAAFMRGQQLQQRDMMRLNQMTYSRIGDE